MPARAENPGPRPRQTVFPPPKAVLSPYGSNGAYDNNGNSVMFLDSLYQNQPLCLRIMNGGQLSYPGNCPTQIFTFDVYTGQETLLQNFPKEQWPPTAYSPEGVGYYVEAATGNIMSCELATGNKRLVTDACAAYNSRVQWEEYDEQGNAVTREMFAAESWTVKRLSQWLVVAVNKMIVEGETWDTIPYTYACHVETGECLPVTHENFFNGAPHQMYIGGETPYGLLVIEEYRDRKLPHTGTGGEPYMLETSQEIYALIDLEDYVHSRASFRTLKPVPMTGMG